MNKKIKDIARELRNLLSARVDGGAGDPVQERFAIRDCDEWFTWAEKRSNRTATAGKKGGK